MTCSSFATLYTAPALRRPHENSCSPGVGTRAAALAAHGPSGRRVSLLAATRSRSLPQEYGVRGTRRGYESHRRVHASASADEPAVGEAVRVKKTGVREEQPDGSFLESYAFNLGGASDAEVKLAFQGGQTGTAVTVSRAGGLGLVLEERRDPSASRLAPTQIVVVEVAPGGNADLTGAVQVGDVLRCCTAVFTVQSPPDVTTWLNPNKKVNALAFFVTDGQSFDKVMSALVSNGQEVDLPDGGVMVPGDIGLVLERPEAPSAS